MAGETTSVYAAVGAELVHFAADLDTGELTRGTSVSLPARVQYAYTHPRLPVLYAVCADRVSDAGVNPYFLCALSIAQDGAPALLETPTALSARPLNLTVDTSGHHVLVVYPKAAAGLSVHEIRDDGTIGRQVPLPSGLDAGPQPHQVRVAPSGSQVFLAARGGKGYGGPKYEPGAVTVLRYDDGAVENEASATVGDGHGLAGFNPRGVDFHPTLPIVFAALDAQNMLAVLAYDGKQVGSEPLFVRELLADRGAVRPRQEAGEVHVHPGGRFVYVANRNDGYAGIPDLKSWLTPDPVPIFPGGENSIAVFAIDERTGEPTLIQHVDSQGLHPRTFALDPSGRVLVVASLAPTVVRDGDELREVPANLAVFGVAADGRLALLHRHDIDTGGEIMTWTGVVAH